MIGFGVGSYFAALREAIQNEVLPVPRNLGEERIWSSLNQTVIFLRAFFCFMKPHSREIVRAAWTFAFAAHFLPRKS